MNDFFNANSPAMRFLSTVADLMVLNLLFIVTSIPLVTLGASITALNDTSIKLVTDRCESVSTTYLRSFRSNFRQGTLLGLAAVGLGLAMYAWYVVVDNLVASPVVKLALLAVLILLGYRVIGTLLFVFAYQATFEDSVGRVLTTARKMSARHPFSALTVLIVTVLPFVVGFYYPQVFVWGVLWFAFGFSGIAFVNATIFARVFQRYGLTSRVEVEA